MTKPSIDDLMAAESRLNRSVAACVVAVLASLGWAFAMAKATGEPSKSVGFGALALFVLQVSCYVWFAVSAGKAAKILGEASWNTSFGSLLPLSWLSCLSRSSPPSFACAAQGYHPKIVQCHI